MMELLKKVAVVAVAYAGAEYINKNFLKLV